MSIITPASDETTQDAPQQEFGQSPRWGPTLKLIVGLTFAALLFALIIYFRTFVGRLLLAFVLIYLLHPVVSWVSRLTHLSWKASVNIVFLVVLLLLAGTLTASGFAVVQQVSNLVEFFQDFITQLPDIAADLSTRTYTIAFFTFDLSELDLTNISARVLEYLEPALSRAGGLVSTFATGAASTLGWTLFVLLIGYFVLSGSTGIQEDLVHVNIPGYDADMRRLGRDLRNIWNLFLRGQLILFVLVVICYQILLAVLGVRYSMVIALMAGFARFIPYIGPLIVWIVLGVVTFFQGSNYFGLEPWQYTLLAIGLGIVLDQIFDNYVSPRILGDSLGVNPAAVLIAAIIAANLIGIVGLVLAAPVLATLNLFGRYAVRKMLDLDPWPQSEEEELRLKRKKSARSFRRVKIWYESLRRRIER